MIRLQINALLLLEKWVNRQSQGVDDQNNK